MGGIFSRKEPAVPRRADFDDDCVLSLVLAYGNGRGAAPAAMPKNEWGPCVWRLLHRRAIAWRHAMASWRRPQPEAAAAELAFLAALFNGLPCAECRREAQAYLRERPPALLAGADSYHHWAFEFHNAVNRRLGKAELPLAAYQEMYGRELIGIV